MSTSSRAWRMRAAFSGDVVSRCRSLNHWACSAVPPGMNCEVKIWRNATTYSGATLKHPCFRANFGEACAWWAHPQFSRKDKK